MYLSIVQKKTTILFVCLFLLLLGVVASVSAGKVKFVDDEELDDIASLVCDGFMSSSANQIRSFTTIRRLLHYTNELEPMDALFPHCVRILNSLKLLNKVVDEGDEHVCSDTKIDLIEEFHLRFVSSQAGKKSPLKETPAPKMLVWFFLHYAYNVGASCKALLLSKLDRIDLAEKSNIPEPISRLQSVLVTKLGLDFSSSLTYPEVFLLWSHLDKSPERNTQFQGGDMKSLVLFNTKDSDIFRTFRQECLLHLRPVYVPSALAIIKLIDLGYYRNDEEFAEEYAKNEKLRNLLGLAQACEFVKPMRTINDTTQEMGVIKKISNKEAEELLRGDSSYKEILPAYVADDYCHLEDSDILPTASSSVKADDFIKAVKVNIKTRDRAASHNLKTVGRDLKNKVKSLAGKLFSVHKSKSSEAPQSENSNEVDA